MKKIISYFLFTLCICCLAVNSFAASSVTQQSCFMLTDLKTQKILKQEGDACSNRIAPCSTFKIALSLMGFESGILKDEKNPVWQYDNKYLIIQPHMLPSWKSPHNPTDWIHDSCVWFSQVLTQKLGMEKFKHYVQILNYGNQDLSGDPGKNNGLTHAWLSSSLKISPHEQLQFLQKMLTRQFPFSKHTYDMTEHILYVTKLSNGWDLHGKTGSGRQFHPDGSIDEQRSIGWYIGWVTKDGRTIIFVKNVIGKNIDGPKVKAQVIDFLQNDDLFSKLKKENAKSPNCGPRFWTTIWRL